jgi:heme/copper-type cytochrome/quinol oxidase subunit 3
VSDAVAATAVLPPDDHHYTATGLPSWKVGFWAFIGSECLFFGTLISTYMVYKGSSVQGPYPDEILNIPLTTISTFVLLMSSLAMVLSLDAATRGRRQSFLSWTAVVIFFGIVFLGFQVYEFTHFVHEGLTIPRNVFGSSSCSPASTACTSPWVSSGCACCGCSDSAGSCRSSARSRWRSPACTGTSWTSSGSRSSR